MIKVFQNIDDFALFIDLVHSQSYKAELEPLREYFTVDELTTLLSIHNSIAERVIGWGYSQIPMENRSWSDFNKARFHAKHDSYFKLLCDSFFDSSLIRLLRFRISKNKNNSKYNQEAHLHLEEQFRLLPTICNVPWFTIPFEFFIYPKSPKAKGNIRITNKDYTGSLFPYHKIRQEVLV